MAERVLMNGCHAIGEAAIRAGLHGYFGYPITPQNELTEYMAKHMPARGRIFLQAESEVAAINMIFGGAAAGARVMTTSSSPGISLMQEGISYIAGARLPCVLVNTMRGGPGLGNIAPSQGDYFQSTKGGGHGDYHMIVYAPSGVQEAVDLTYKSFEVAERYRVPVMILSDGMIAQMMEPVVLPPEKEPPSLEKPWALTGAKGRERRIVRSLWLNPPDGVEKNNIVLQKTYKEIVANEKRWEVFGEGEYLLVGYGTMGRMLKKVVSILKENGINAFLFRPITLWPFPYEEIYKLNPKKVFVLEMSAGQMVEDVYMAVKGSVPVYFYGRMGGGVPTPAEVAEVAKNAWNGDEACLWTPGKPNA